MNAERRAMIKDALILFSITLAAGVLLGIVHDVTKEPIARQKAKAKAEAYRSVFSEADSFVPADGGGPTAGHLADSGVNADINEVMQALDRSGRLLGYVITVTDHEGYGGDIQFSMGVALDGTLNGISLLSISETAGLGMKAGAVLVPQFADRKVEQFTYTKSGSAGDSEIDAISGATVTTSALVDGVNAGLAFFRSSLARAEGGAANE